MLFSRYKIIKILGEGGSSTVYLAKDIDESCDVAIKSIPLWGRREYEIMSDIKHEQIVRLKNVIETKTGIYLVIERCECNLFEFMNSYEYDVKCVLKIMRMVLVGLRYLHRRHIIHRDIKLANILVKGDEVKISDFGLSCYEWDNDMSYCGTKDYLAPEMKKGLCKKKENKYNRHNRWSMVNIGLRDNTVKGKEENSLNGISLEYSNKIDIYASGVVFKTLISRKREIGTSQIGDIDGRFLRFLGRMLDENPDRRYSAEEALQDDIFSELFLNIPDFRLVVNFQKTNKYGKITRSDNFIEIEYSTGEEVFRNGTKYSRTETNNFRNRIDNSSSGINISSLRIEYEEGPCLCRGQFVYRVLENGVVVSKEFLPNRAHKYYNYLCKYLEILCGRTVKTSIIEKDMSMTLFLDNTAVLDFGRMRIYGNGRRKYKVVPGDRDLTVKEQRVFDELYRRCIIYIENSCVCNMGKKLYNKSIVDRFGRPILDRPINKYENKSLCNENEKAFGEDRTKIFSKYIDTTTNSYKEKITNNYSDKIFYKDRDGTMELYDTNIERNNDKIRGSVQPSTIDITLNESCFTRQFSGIEQMVKKHIPGIGWSLKERLVFFFLLDDGVFYKIDARTQSINYRNKDEKINRDISSNAKILLKRSLPFLLLFRRDLNNL